MANKNEKMKKKDFEKQLGELQVELARMLSKHCFADRWFFCNGGAEANEAAIKLARRYSHEKYGPGRHTIITMEGSFHGRTMATLSATGQYKVQEGYAPLLEGFRFVPFNDLPGLEKAVDDTVCIETLPQILRRLRTGNAKAQNDKTTGPSTPSEANLEALR